MIPRFPLWLWLLNALSRRLKRRDIMRSDGAVYLFKEQNFPRFGVKNVDLCSLPTTTATKAPQISERPHRGQRVFSSLLDKPIRTH